LHHICVSYPIPRGKCPVRREPHAGAERKEKGGERRGGRDLPLHWNSCVTFLSQQHLCEEEYYLNSSRKFAGGTGRGGEKRGGRRGELVGHFVHLLLFGGEFKGGPTVRRLRWRRRGEKKKKKGGGGGEEKNPKTGNGPLPPTFGWYSNRGAAHSGRVVRPPTVNGNHNGRGKKGREGRERKKNSLEHAAQPDGSFLPDVVDAGEQGCFKEVRCGRMPISATQPGAERKERKRQKRIKRGGERGKAQLLVSSGLAQIRSGQI